MLQAAVEAQVAAYAATPGPAHPGIHNAVPPLRQFSVLVHRMLLVNVRDVGVFWIRLGMYLALCVCLGTVYFQLGTSWNEGVPPDPAPVQKRAAPGPFTAVVMDVRCQRSCLSRVWSAGVTGGLPCTAPAACG